MPLHTRLTSMSMFPREEIFVGSAQAAEPGTEVLWNVRPAQHSDGVWEVLVQHDHVRKFLCLVPLSGMGLAPFWDNYTWSLHKVGSHT